MGRAVRRTVVGTDPAGRASRGPFGAYAERVPGLLWSWISLRDVVPACGLKGVHATHRRSYGWLGSAGFFVSFVALVLAFVGGALELTKMASTGTGSTVGYLTSTMSFLLLAWGSVLLGLAITGVLHDALPYFAGLLLAIGVPLGLLVVFVAGASRGFFFSPGLTAPYGVAWLLLGYALLSARGPAAQPSRFS
jgi:hypothetical protein